MPYAMRGPEGLEGPRSGATRTSQMLAEASVRTCPRLISASS